MCDVWSTTCESFYENIFLLVPDHYEILTLRTFLKGFTCNLALDQSKKPPCTWTTLGHHLGRALHFAWCSPIMRWPGSCFPSAHVMRFLAVALNAVKDVEWSGWQKVCLEPQIECFESECSKSSGWCFPSFPSFLHVIFNLLNVLPSKMAGWNNL